MAMARSIFGDSLVKKYLCLDTAVLLKARSFWGRVFPIELQFGSVGFGEGGKTENPEKNPRSKDENQQQTQPVCDSGSGNRTQATLVGDERSQHCANPVCNNVYNISEQ